MFVHYARELLRAEDGLSQSEKERLAERIERWARKNNVQDVGTVHRVLDGWIDGRLGGSGEFLVQLNRKVGEGDIELIDLVQDPKAQNPAEILIADGSIKHVSASEAKRYISEHLEGEPLALLSSILDQNPDGEYGIDAEPQTLRERIALVQPHFRDGKIIVPDHLDPEQIVDIRFANGELRIEYTRGYSDQALNMALYWYSQGYNANQVAQKMGMNRNTIRDWLYTRMNLPRIGPGKRAAAAERIAGEVVRLYNEGVRPVEIMRQVNRGRRRVYKILRAQGHFQHEAHEAIPRGSDPWVYSLTGIVELCHGPDGLDSRLPPVYHPERYDDIFLCVKASERVYRRGSTRIEIGNILGYEPEPYLKKLLAVGVLSRRKVSKQHL